MDQGTAVETGQEVTRLLALYQEAQRALTAALTRRELATQQYQSAVDHMLTVWGTSDPAELEAQAAAVERALAEQYADLEARLAALERALAEDL